LRPEDDRGTGTVQLIEAFQQLHRECAAGDTQEPSMAIISGSTHILFNGKYRMEKDSNGRHIIAFNEKNDLNDPPDEDCVTRLGDVAFPGTIVSLQFNLNPGKKEN